MTGPIMMLARLGLALLAVDQATQPPVQTRPPTFRSTTRLVVQAVTVKDKNGSPVRGLGPTDFVVTEDGQPQSIAFVEYQPLEDAPSAVAPNAGSVAPLIAGVDIPGDARYRGRRLIVFYFDLYNMADFDQARMYAAADHYVAVEMSPADLVAVMVFERGAAHLEQDFTDDREALRSLLTTLAESIDSGRDALGATAESAGAFGEDNDTFNLFTTDRQLSALQTAVTGLGPLPEIKTLVYFGSGLRLSGADNQAQLRATVNAAVRSNVTINPIDTRGLMATPPLGDAARRSPGGIGMFSGALQQTAINIQQQANDSYYALAKDTGGRATFDDNDLSRGIVNAARAVGGYYVLGYYSANLAADGLYRRVKVAIRGGAADVSYRPGYYGEKPFAKFNGADKERQLEEAFRLEDPVTDIPMAMEVNYFQLNRAEYFVPVSVRMPGSELARARPNGAGKAEIDILAEIKDTHGVTVRNAKDRLAFSLDSADAERASRRPIQYETGFTLLPGDYVIKMLARDATTGRIGTFQTSFTVPNLARERVRVPISSVVLTEQRAAVDDALYKVKQAISADAANPLVAGGMRLIPAVTRVFSGSRPLVALLHAYEPDAAAMRPLVAIAALYRDATRVFEGEPMGIAEGWDPVSRGVPVPVEVPLESIPDGTYDLQISVLDPDAGRAAFWRSSIVVRRPPGQSR